MKAFRQSLNDSVKALVDFMRIEGLSFALTRLILKPKGRGTEASYTVAGPGHQRNHPQPTGGRDGGGDRLPQRISPRNGLRPTLLLPLDREFTEQEQRDSVRREVMYAYKFMTDFNKFDEPLLPTKTAFYSILSESVSILIEGRQWRITDSIPRTM